MTFTVDLRDYPEADQLSWEFGDGGVLSNATVAAGRAVSHEYSSSGVFTVRVHLFDGGDLINNTPPKLIATGSLPVEVHKPNALPTAAFEILDVLGTDNVALVLTKRFSAIGSSDSDGNIVKYEWDFGDNSTGEGFSIEHTFAASGRYTVSLKVTDDHGGTAETNRSVLLDAPPTAAFNFSVAPSDGRTVTFDAGQSTDSDGSIATFSWDFGDSSPIGSGSPVTHTYAAAGNFNVTLTVTDNIGVATAHTQSVHVPGLEIVIQSVTPSFGVVDTTVTGVDVRGDNFPSVINNVRLERNSRAIPGSNVQVVSNQQITVDFNLTGAELGDYDVALNLQGQSPVRLRAGFRVGTADHVRLETTNGDIVMQLVSDAPITTANYLRYVGEHFYDGTIFHRVVPNFVVQGGGFLPGMVPQTGVHDPIQNEFSPSRRNLRGTVAMAKLSGQPDSATSEFFVNLADNPTLDDTANSGGFTVFANVVTGMDVVDAIAAVPLNGEVPVTDVIVTRARRE